eukprot:gnl/TRDRNA2_/TRDRNA2_153805_c0_seq2.p1 gnl/TRDRNA2_/TRDRNA2_153805_c0~~gnl/TRDRNA2_/TRDRNA2_153805_c0_seq2.p1  ORF type:complete len:816 (+),score=142.21 gnl/TRDRNA2_/TRDRNA2_153805_c0_seq2:173-2449(+)
MGRQRVASSSQRVASSDGSISTGMRATVVGLVFANVAVFSATWHCIHLLGQEESAMPYAKPDVDFSALYEEDSSGASLAPGSQAAPKSQAPEITTRAPEAATVTPVAMAPVVPKADGVATALRMADGQQKAAVIDRLPWRTEPPPPPQVAPRPAVEAAQRATAAGSSTACHACSSKVTGPLPTTLRGPRSSSECRWSMHEKKYIGALVSGMDMQYSLAMAKEFCIELGIACTGIVCNVDGQQCTVRGGKDLADSPINEVAWMKDCSSVSASSCDDDGSALPVETEDLRGAAVVILAHNRADALQDCLESLLGLVDASMFKFHVSLDDEKSFPPMTAVVNQVAAAKGVEIEVWQILPLEITAQHNQEQRRWFFMNAGKIAHHYWMVFERAFMDHKYENVIFVEEDLIFSPDFLSMFRSTSGLMKRDQSIWCVSAWNDIGFSSSFSDQCRLFRTTYFPGLGFLLPRYAWLQLREVWPVAPTMGWDYWMRVAFRRFEKECVIPEVPRSRHAAKKGSSVTHSKQLLLFASMALATIPSVCGLTQPCQQFGDISYLMLDNYERWVREAIAKSQIVSIQDIRSAAGLDSKALYVVPYLMEEYNSIVEPLGLRPKGTANAIPADIRGEHYGVLDGRHLASRTRVLLVDRRSSRHYLPPKEQVNMSSNAVAMAAKKGESCSAACSSAGMWCDSSQLHFVNDCQALRKHFGCEQGCAHQVGKELPVYVPEPKEPTYQQCLVTFISAMKCDGKHDSTQRLCACLKNGP